MTHAPTRALLASVGTASRPHGHRRRHHRGTSPGLLVDDGLRIDLDQRTITVGETALDLTYLEFELLAYLLLHPRQVFTRRQLMETVWGYPEIGGGRTVDVHVARLRRKLGARHRRRLTTVRRVGYKYEPHDLSAARRFAPQARSEHRYAQARHRA
ncbi:winged helix-turn-helix domain-containing protein [Yinghuangia sp. YIM S10712]|uniref:winged helix-turn-helix domain-containing protein n=1 Tax=Yinghuangia sp. YIM S10712 TaxID=3436930 RepID=UPI003F5387B0